MKAITANTTDAMIIKIPKKNKYLFIVPLLLLKVEQRLLLDGSAVLCLDNSQALTLEAFAALVEVFLVELAAYIIEAHLVRGNA